MPFGILDTRYIDLPASIDAAYIEGLRTRAGVDFAQILRELDSRIAALNNTVDPLVAALVYPTSELTADGTRPTAFTVERAGEYTIIRPQLVEGAAYPLPISKYDVSLGFTEDGLESMRLSRILTNVDSLFMGMRRMYRREALRRLTSDAEVRVDNRTTMKSPGFAGSGTGDNVFTGPYPDGTALPGGYTHYYRDTTANRATVVKAARDRLRKWYPGPYDLIAPQSEIDALALINPGNPTDGFVSADTLLVRGATANASAQVPPEEFVGVLFGDIRVHKPIEDWSTANITIFKTFGNFDPQNPIAWRFDELMGREAFVRSREMYPLANAVLVQWAGFGVNNRVAAVNILIAASGSYVPPTILT
jgi:hypothetical protein